MAAPLAAAGAAPILRADAWTIWSRPNGWPHILANRDLAIGRFRASSCRAAAATPRAEFLAAHIPGARFLDIDELSRPIPSGAAHAAVGRATSARRWRRSGSTATTASSSMTIRRSAPPRAAGSCCAISAPRRVAILDGGLQKWPAEGRPVESGEPAPRAARFEAAERAGEVVSQGRHPRRRSAPPLVDARGKARFEGSEPDPRPGLPPATSRARATCRSRRSTTRTAPSSREEICARPFAAAGSRPARAVRRHLRVGRHRQFADLRRASARQRATRLYDGSWSEWGADPSTPKERSGSAWTGLAAHQAREIARGRARISSAIALGWPRRWARGPRRARPAGLRARPPPRSRSGRAARRSSGAWTCARLAQLRPAARPSSGSRPARRRTDRPAAAHGECSPAAPALRHKAAGDRRSGGDSGAKWSIAGGNFVTARQRMNRES